MLSETFAFVAAFALYISAVIACILASVYLTINNYTGASCGIFALAVLLILGFPNIKTSGECEKCKAKKH